MVQGGRCQAQDAERTKDLRKSVESAGVTIMSFCLDANGPKNQDLDLFAKK